MLNSIVLNEIVVLPDKLVQLGKRPGDPPNAAFYAMESAQSKDIVQYMPIAKENAMDYSDLKGLVDGVHNELGETQGLIEVLNGKTSKGKNYIYSIIKSALSPQRGGGVTYTLCLDVDFEGFCLRVMGFFKEVGITGVRDSACLELERRKSGYGSIEDVMRNWRKDPCDENYTKGNLMNLSEQREYDEAFPDHPLSLLRQFTDFFISNN